MRILIAILSLLAMIACIICSILYFDADKLFLAILYAACALVWMFNMVINLILAVEE